MQYLTQEVSAATFNEAVPADANSWTINCVNGTVIKYFLDGEGKEFAKIVDSACNARRYFVAE